MRYELYYWPGIQGRGEFVRLALEAAGADYVDIARRASRSGMGMPALLRGMNDDSLIHPPFAPPYLKAGRQVIGQTAAILLFLGPRLRLAPRDEAGRLWCHQLQLTIADMVAEAHDTHHPVAGNLYYHEQKREAKRAARSFIGERIPKFLGYFERVLDANPRGPEHAVGAAWSYADLSLFQLVAGLSYAFPRAMQGAAEEFPHLMALHAAVQKLPRVARYLKSKRRLAFNQQGIFRHYPELDARK